MRRHQKPIPILLVLVGTFVAFVLAPPTTEAAFQLRLSDGTSTVLVQDGGPGDLSPVPGQISFVGNVGLFTVSSSLGESKPLLPGPGLDIAELVITSFDVRAKGQGTLTISLTDTGYTAPTSSGNADLILTSKLNSSSGPLGGPWLTFQSFADANNQAFGIAGATTPGAQGPFPGSVGGNVLATTFDRQGPYSLTSVTTIHFSNGGQIGFDGFTEVFGDPNNVLTPAPGGFTLALIGLPFLGFTLWVRRRRQPI
jgi:hypothetical protein